MRVSPRGEARLSRCTLREGIFNFRQVATGLRGTMADRVKAATTNAPRKRRPRQARGDSNGEVLTGWQEDRYELRAVERILDTPWMSLACIPAQGEPAREKSK